MPTDLSGKVAIVTGGSQGLGMSTACWFVECGAAVCIADIRTEGEMLAKELREAGGQAIYVPVDVTSEADCAEMVAVTTRTFGRLDYAYNNAGVLEDRARLAEIPIAQWHNVIGVNLTGVFLCMRAELPVMVEGGGGVIVNCSSVAGLSGRAAWQMSAYASSKAGVISMTRAAAHDYAQDRIRVVAVCPGGIETEMLRETMDANPEFASNLIKSKPLGRLGRPEEIAKTVVWLCSDEASYITGVAVQVDGAAYN